MAGGGMMGGALLAAYSGMVWSALNKPGLFVWSVLAGFLALPLADLAIAPLSLAWNRHR